MRKTLPTRVPGAGNPRIRCLPNRDGMETTVFVALCELQPFGTGIAPGLSRSVMGTHVRDHSAGRCSEAQARLLCYLLGPFSAGIFLHFPPYGNIWSIRFHAFHSALMTAVWGLAWGLLRLLEQVCPLFLRMLAGRTLQLMAARGVAALRRKPCEARASRSCSCTSGLSRYQVLPSSSWIAAEPLPTSSRHTCCSPGVRAAASTRATPRGPAVSLRRKSRTNTWWSSASSAAPAENQRCSALPKK